MKNILDILRINLEGTPRVTTRRRDRQPYYLHKLSAPWCPSSRPCCRILLSTRPGLSCRFCSREGRLGDTSSQMCRKVERTRKSCTWPRSPHSNPFEYPLYFLLPPPSSTPNSQLHTKWAHRQSSLNKFQRVRCTKSQQPPP